jgi:hypothetical protein
MNILIKKINDAVFRISDQHYQSELAGIIEVQKEIEQLRGNLVASYAAIILNAQDSRRLPGRNQSYRFYEFSIQFNEDQNALLPLAVNRLAETLVFEGTFMKDAFWEVENVSNGKNYRILILK